MGAEISGTETATHAPDTACVVDGMRMVRVNGQPAWSGGQHAGAAAWSGAGRAIRAGRH
jgi:hypothetical protein